MNTVLSHLKSYGKVIFSRLFERSIRVYIQKHLGEFLVGKLTTDQVDLGLDGGTLESLYLNAEAINEKLDNANVPFTLVNGYIDLLKLHIPWTKISTESILVEVDGLMLTIKMKEEELDEGVDMKSIVESMTASMVEEVMKSEVATADAEKIAQDGKEASPFESVELMSELISSITSRIQIVLKDVLVKMEKMPGVFLEVHIKELDYFDKDSTTTKDRKPNVPPTPEGFSTKVVEILDMRVRIEEVKLRERWPEMMDPLDPQVTSTMAFEDAMNSPPTTGHYMHSSMAQSIYPGANPFSDDDESKEDESDSIPIISINKTQTVSIQIKNNDLLPGPTVNVSWNMESLHVFMCPKVLQLLTTFLGSEEKQAGLMSIPMTHEDFKMCKNAFEEETQDGPFDGPNVPPLGMANHIDLMHGGTADSLSLEGDMFYSAYPNVHKNLSSFDASDSASVSTFAANSTFSSPHANSYSHSKKQKEFGRHLSDNVVDTQNVNITIPFFTVTLLHEDPEQSLVVLPTTLKTPFNNYSSTPLTKPSVRHSQKSFINSEKWRDKKLLSDHNYSPGGFTETCSSFISLNRDEDTDDEEYLDSNVDPDKNCTASRQENFFKETSEEPIDHKFGLQEVACTYFEQVALVDFRIPFHELREKFTQLVPYDHFGLLAKPVQINILQEKKASESGLKAKVTMGKLEVVECLFGSLPPKSNFSKTTLPKFPQYSELLIFDGNGTSEATNVMHEAFDMFDTSKTRTSQSALTIMFESVSAKKRGKDSVAHKLSLEFGKLTSELDITIIDRLSTLLNSCQNGSSPATQLMNDQYGQLDETMLDDQTTSQMQVDFNLKITEATLRVRFPIPDLRDDKVKEDYCPRNLHTEVLVLEMESPKLTTKTESDPEWKMEIQVFKIKAYLQHDINVAPILFGEISVEESLANPCDENQLDWPRLVIKKKNKPESELEFESKSDASGNSIEFLESLQHQDFSPFSQKKTMFERDDLSSNRDCPDNDEMVMPGDAKELSDFRSKCQSHTNMSIEISVPSITAYFHDKDFIELLYNRFNNDLLMWAPTESEKGSKMNNLEPSSICLNVEMMLQKCGQLPGSTFGPTSAGAELGDSDGDEDLDPEESLHYSIHDRSKQSKTSRPKAIKPINKLCFSLDIGKGKLLAVIPHVNAEKSSTNEANLHGEMMITLNRGFLTSVNQYAEDPDLKYLCFHANRIEMYHNAHVTTPPLVGTLDHIRDKIHDHLNARVYRSDRGAGETSQGRAGWGEDSPYMLTLVVKTKMDTINNIKNFIVAVSVNGGTLRHEIHNTGESWISQAMDLLDLKDNPILGYTVPKVMTELHLQLHHCCVDFRPLHLPMKSFLTVERFSVCTNVIAESDLSLVRLLFDRSTLYLSQTSKCNRDLDYIKVNLIDDYVCVAEMDQLKIWLQFGYSKSGKQKVPKSDLRFMCNYINIQTCADSCKALFDLIEYLVNDGDLTCDVDNGSIAAMDENDCGSLHSMDGDSEERQVPSPVIPIPTLTPEQEASVMSALEDAMVDCPVQRKREKDSNQSGGGGTTKVYFHDSRSSKAAMRNIDDELGDAMHITVEDSDFSMDGDAMSDQMSDHLNSNEDFEIVDDLFKELSRIEGSHEMQILSADEIDMKEKYIRKPTSSYDHLRAPVGFPDPEYQYTLREMSVVWQLFGGSDFSHLRPNRDLAADQIGLAKVVTSPLSSRKRQSEVGRDGRKVVKHKGGKNRDMNCLMELDLNKVRFRYEVYPAITEQSSRFKFLVHNLEIRDRMKASEINKFLMKLVDKDHPEQSSVYMVMFSGVFTRPQYLTFREECQVKAFCLPIKLNVDQGSFNFLRKFITQVTSSEAEQSFSSSGRASPMTVHSSPRASVSSTEPIMRIGETHTKEQSMDETELLIKFEDYSVKQSTYLQNCLNETDDLDIPQENLPVFIKSFILICDVTIKLDYRGKQCDMDTGVLGMMLGVASLSGSVITLKRINCQKGILGWNKLLMYVANEWLTDICKRQIHTILKGVGSFNIIFQIVQGITDLVRLPIEQYQRDRRIIRGIQRGANSFTFNTLMALFELTHKIVGSIQYCAELGYDMMSPGPSVRRRKQLQQKYHQPRNTVEGAKTALQLVTDGARDSMSNLTAIVSEEGAHKGTVGMVGATLRNAPQECLIKPIAIIAEAGTNIVKGMRNQMDPNKMKEEENTWKQV